MKDYGLYRNHEAGQKTKDQGLQQSIAKHPLEMPAQKTDMETLREDIQDREAFHNLVVDGMGQDKTE